MTTRRKLLEACVRSRLTYGVQAWPPREEKIRKLEVFWIGCLRSMVKGGWKHKNVDEGEYSFQYTNQQVQDIVQTVPLREFIHTQYLRYIAHVCRQENGSITKKILFAKASKKYFRDPWLQIAGILGVSVEQAKKETQNKHKFAELVQKRTSSPL